MSNQKLHVLRAPLLLQSEPGQPYCLLPAGTTLFFEESMSEGYDCYTVYLNFKGTLPLEETDKPNLRVPIWAYPIGKQELAQLLAGYPLSKDELAQILESSKITREELEELVRSFKE